MYTPGIATAIASLLPAAKNIGGALLGTAQQYGARPLSLYNSPKATSGGLESILGGISKIPKGTTGAQAAKPNQGQQQTDPIAALYAQLIDQLRSPVDMPTGIDTKNLMGQVQSALNPIYDQRIQAAEAQTGRARKDVQGMYAALSNEYKQLAPQQIEQANLAKQEIENLYGQLRSNIQGDFSRVSNEQSELFKQLGIEDALPEVLAEQQAPVQDALIAASENQAQQQQRYMDIGQQDATYYREGAPLATMTGNEISSDLLFQLQQYTNQANAERTAGIQSGYMDQLSNAQNQLAQMQQSGRQEEARRQEMLMQMLNSQMQAQSKPQELNVNTFMSSLPEQMRSSVANSFTQLQRSPEAVYGKVEDKRNPVPGTFVDTNPNWYMAQADNLLQQGQIDAATHQALLMYMQLYFGLGSK